MLKQKQSKTKSSTKKLSSQAESKPEVSKTEAKTESSKAKKLSSKTKTKVKTESPKNKLKPEAQTRLLLFLWDMGGKEISQGELTEKLKRGKEKATVYQPIFQQLDKDGAIAVSAEGKTAKVSLMDKGLQMLDSGLKNPEFKFDGNQIDTNVANALVKWIGSIDKPVSVDPDKSAMASHSPPEIANSNKSKNSQIEAGKQKKAK
ncbi:MAG: hypothetical protein ACRC11_09405 [Xenococcaceae cyanobacterium]